jgi:ATP-dependent DNA helicase RecQ
LKFLLRGERPFTTYFTERAIISCYGDRFGLEEDAATSRGRIEYRFLPELKNYYERFSNHVSPWAGNVNEVSFDPQHPQNEQMVFTELIARFGQRLAHLIKPQAPIETILPRKLASSFSAQRVDFLISLPNGKAVIVEPGDHDTDVEASHDETRDKAFNSIGAKTVRFRNNQIEEDSTYDRINIALRELGIGNTLEEDAVQGASSVDQLAHLWLLPSLVSRVMRLLVHFCFRQGLVHREKLRVGIYERDLEYSEVSIAAFQELVKRLCRLYQLNEPRFDWQIHVQSPRPHRTPKLGEYGITAEHRSALDDLQLDLIIDAGIQCNELTPPITVGAACIGTSRRSYVHNRVIQLGYRSRCRPTIVPGNNELLNTFVRDCFRKRQLRSGQGPIIKNALAEIHTIGLLPTSAGKSLCYQIASLLTPGTTIIVDPIVALMRDQVQSLTEEYGIDRVVAWHAGSGLRDVAISTYLSQNIMVFLSPERFLRPSFRAAMQGLSASDIFINFAVIDEAHCVSMWGHDFRPAYLTLERNFRSCSSFQNRSPVILALTGTASQLVLIDLMRELNISDPNAIVRPETFDRPELNFEIVQCPADNADEVLRQVMTAVANRLNVQDLTADAHGIVFAYTPNELWRLLGLYSADARSTVQSVMRSTDEAEIRFAMYSGGPPRDSGMDPREWETYKANVLELFKKGAVNLLFGNAAVSVGIDNEKLNYVVNYRMPQSMEAYYQQCGRAGRAGQSSQCYLIYSDDQPALTTQWLDRQVEEMPRRHDDLGIVAFFPRIQLPGEASRR